MNEGRAFNSVFLARDKEQVIESVLRNKVPSNSPYYWGFFLKSYCRYTFFCKTTYTFKLLDLQKNVLKTPQFVVYLTW